MKKSDDWENARKMVDGYVVKEMFDFLIRNSKDLSNYYNQLEKNGGIPFFALCEIRKQKINKSTISKEEFVDSFSRDKVQALEELFQQHVSEKYIDCLENNSRITPEKLYDLHTINKYTSFLQFIL